MIYGEKAELAEALNRLTFVVWDRFTEGDDGVHVYGWIERDDARSDFILLECELRDEGWAIGFTTSSAKYSHEIGALLYDAPSADHQDCQRVEDEFAGLVERTTRLTPE